MPAEPPLYALRNWKEVAEMFDDRAYDLSRTGGTEDSDDETFDVIDINKNALEYDADEFTIDGGVHLSPLGHQIYAETIGNYLEDRYGGTSAP